MFVLALACLAMYGLFLNLATVRIRTGREFIRVIIHRVFK